MSSIPTPDEMAHKLDASDYSTPYDFASELIRAERQHIASVMCQGCQDGDPVKLDHGYRVHYKDYQILECDAREVWGNCLYQTTTERDES